MKLLEFIVPDAIVAELKARTRDEAIRELVQSLCDSGAVKPSLGEELTSALIKREKSATTGFGKGVAVPHVKHAGVMKMVGAVGRSVEGVDFSALDAQPVYSIFLLLSPENQPQQHLQAMNIVFTNLQDDMFRRFLRQADSKQKIVDLLDEADGK